MAAIKCEASGCKNTDKSGKIFFECNKCRRWCCSDPGYKGRKCPGCQQGYRGGVPSTRVISFKASYEIRLNGGPAEFQSPLFGRANRLAFERSEKASLCSAFGLANPLSQLFGVRGLWTADRDFSRLPDLLLRNSLVCRLRT
jgi:hypothetical protein